MIVPMRHLDLLCVSGERERALERLRELGAVHLDLASAKGAGVATVRGEAEEAERAVRLIVKTRGGRDDMEVRPRSVSEILALDADRAKLKEVADELGRTIRTYAPYGDFDPDLARRLGEAGVTVALREDGTYGIGYGEATVATEVPLPEMRLSKMTEKLARIQSRIAVDDAKIAGCDERAILAAFPALRDRLAFEAAKELMSEKGPVSFVSGWIPAPKAAAFAEVARASGWGYLLREAADGETPPTLVEPPRLFRPVKALFDGLGIAPAYVESDVSVPFMCYFSLFFAMLVGDGAYGAIFLAATAWGWWKYRGLSPASRESCGLLMRSWLVLLTVFSAATVAWGVLSNTWFGAGIPACRDWPTVRWLADPSYHNMMLLCFTIGVSHLMLARIWNGVCKINDSTCVAEFGWAGVLLFMYLVTNSIVGIFPGIPSWGYVVLGLSLVAVFEFSVKPSELKTRGAELGMLPLNIMSALGDIISYVRLFAVGLASVKVAENFNSMATGLVAGADSVAVKAIMAVAMVAILVVGHALNLAMAALSILVHAVRLNTLEFSNHKGVSWSGYAFRPFAKKS